MTNNTQQIGRRVRELRFDHGLTQEALALKADMSAPHVSCIENGSRKASLAVLVKLADVFEVDAAALIFGSARGTGEIFAEFARLFDGCDERENRLMLAAAIGAAKALKNGLRE